MESEVNNFVIIDRDEIKLFTLYKTFDYISSSFRWR